MSVRRTSRREFLKVAGLTGLGLIAASCAPQTSATSTAAPAATAAATSAPAATAAATAAVTAAPSVTPTVAPFVVGSGNLTVNIWGWQASRMKLFADVAKDFTDKNPNIKVVVSVFGSDIETKLNASVPAGTGPTLSKMQTTRFFPMRDNGLFLELPKDVFPDDYLRSKFPYHDWATYGRFCCPEGIQPAFMAYNKVMFKDAGLDPEKPPKTWDDFFAAAQKLTKRDANGTMTVAGVQFDNWLPLMNPLYQQGGNLVKRDGASLTANFKTPEMEKAIGFFIDALRKYKVWDPQFPYYSDAIGNRKAAMTVGESWVYGNWKSSFPDVFKELGFAAPPTPTGDAKPYFGRKNSVLGLALLANRPPDETAAGTQFLEYLYKERIDSQLAIATFDGLVPTRIESLQSDAVLNDPFIKLGANLIAKEYDTVQVPSALDKVINDTLNTIILQNKSISDALDFGQAGLQKLIDGGDLKYIV